MNLSSRQLFHLRLRLLQPERHLHLAVHRRRGGEVLLRLLALARAPVELAEAEVAVGDEGHAPHACPARWYSSRTGGALAKVSASFGSSTLALIRSTTSTADR